MRNQCAFPYKQCLFAMRVAEQWKIDAFPAGTVGMTGRQPRLAATERHEHDQRMEAGRSPGSGNGGPRRGRGRHRLGRTAASPGAAGGASLHGGAGPLGSDVAPGAPGPAPPLARWPLVARLAIHPPGVPPLTAHAAAGAAAIPPAPVRPMRGVPGPLHCHRTSHARRTRRFTAPPLGVSHPNYTLTESQLSLLNVTVLPSLPASNLEGAPRGL